jgi:outer membrane lipoprotein-sorting protein
VGAGRHAAAWRWVLVAALVGALGALPGLLGALPAADAGASAAALRERALGSAAVGHSGYAESSGGLLLPQFTGLPSVAASLGAVADLLSDRTTMRVWWRGPEDNRVDVVTSAGETDVHRDPAGTWTWDYLAQTATRTAAARVALPAAPDLVPAALGRRLLSEATPAELSRIGSRRVAGRDALGLRVRPAEAAASVGQVDVWVDRATGLPLAVEVTGRGLTQPSLTTRYLDLDPTPPPAALTGWDPPAGVRVRTGTADPFRPAAGLLRRVALPADLAALPRRPAAGTRGTGVALYGRGVTLLAVVAVPPAVSGGFRTLLAKLADQVTDDLGTRATAGPLGLALVDSPGGSDFLLAGTVTADALRAAAGQLRAARQAP